MNLLNNADTAQLLGLKPNTLEIWRCEGRGPAFLKIGRSVRYRETDVLEWLEQQTFTSTSDYDARQRERLVSA